MRRVWAAAVLAVLAVFGVAMGGVASADGDPLVGTWHERDEGTSNIFWFIDEPVDGVFPVTYYDDWTGVCDNNGPMTVGPETTRMAPSRRARPVERSVKSRAAPQPTAQVTTTPTVTRNQITRA